MARSGFWISLPEQGVMFGLICTWGLHPLRIRLSQTVRNESIYNIFKHRSAFIGCLFYTCNPKACLLYIKHWWKNKRSAVSEYGSEGNAAFSREQDSTVSLCHGSPHLRSAPLLLLIAQSLTHTPNIPSAASRATDPVQPRGVRDLWARASRPRRLQGFEEVGESVAATCTNAVKTRPATLLQPKVPPFAINCPECCASQEIRVLPWKVTQQSSARGLSWDKSCSACAWAGGGRWAGYRERQSQAEPLRGHFGPSCSSFSEIAWKS